MTDARAAPQRRLLTYRQTSTYLGLSERKLWTLVSESEIPVVRSGRSVRFDKADLDEWIERMKR